MLRIFKIMILMIFYIDEVELKSKMVLKTRLLVSDLLNSSKITANAETAMLSNFSLKAWCTHMKC